MSASEAVDPRPKGDGMIGRIMELVQQAMMLAAEHSGGALPLLDTGTVHVQEALAGGLGVLLMEVERDHDPGDFDKVLDTLGIRGMTDYHIQYDAETGNEVYIFDRKFLS